MYASNENADQHKKARTWLSAQLGGRTKVGLPWPSLLACLRITTNPRIFTRPAPVDRVWMQIFEWISAPAAWVPTPTDRHASILGGLLLATGRGGDLVPDAHLAALAIAHGLVLCSTDSDFARFPDLRWENPLA